MIKKYEPVVVFEYDKVKYCIVIVNGFIKFYKYIDNKLSEALSEKDIRLLLSVHRALTINKSNSIPIRNEYIDNKQFQIWYDSTSTLYFWYEIKNGSLCDAEDKYNTILNLKYNNTGRFVIKREMFDIEAYEASKAKKEKEQAEQVEYDENISQEFNPVEIFDWEVYEKEQQEKNKKEKSAKKIRRNIKIGTVVVCATIIGSLSFIKYSDAKVAKKVRQAIPWLQTSISEETDTLEDNIERIKNQPYNYDDIQKAIDQNEFMTTEEKELLKSLKFYFDENHEYIDTDLVQSRFSTLKFEYKDEAPHPSIGGGYYPSVNIICLYRGSKFSDIDIRIIIHEIMHVMQCVHTKRFTMELSDEIATRELLRQMVERNLLQDTSIFENEYKYNSEYGVGYNPCLPVQYALYELLSQEEIKQYQFYPDSDIIINALEQIAAEGKPIVYNSFTEQAYRARAIWLLDAIDDLRVLDENDIEVIQYSDEKFKRIFNMIDTYYVQKNGISMEQSISADITNIDFSNRGRVPIIRDKLTTLCYTFAALTGGESNESITGYLESNFGNNVYVLPKTYFSNDHKYTKVILDTPEPMVVDVNELAQKVFTYKQSWVEDMNKRIDESPTSYKADLTNFYYFERQTEDDLEH